ncbi:MAG TPA: acyl-CoA dehydrogenase family protein, partial [Acidimicrobiales bacterium]
MGDRQAQRAVRPGGPGHAERHHRPRRREGRQRGRGALSPDLDSFRDEAVAFLDKAQAAGTACPAYGAILPPALHDQARAWQREMADGGFAGLHWPVEHGGRGLSRAHTGVWLEECARAQVQPYLNLQGLVLAGEAILRSGSDRQR